MASPPLRGPPGGSRKNLVPKVKPTLSATFWYGRKVIPTGLCVGWGGSILPKGRPYGTLRGARVSTMLYGDVTTIYIRALFLKGGAPKLFLF